MSPERQSPRLCGACFATPQTQKAAPVLSNRNAEDAANDGQDRQNHAIYSAADPKPSVDLAKS